MVARSTAPSSAAPTSVVGTAIRTVSARAGRVAGSGAESRPEWMPVGKSSGAENAAVDLKVTNNSRQKRTRCGRRL
jgi:hypothetical protein